MPNTTSNYFRAHVKAMVVGACLALGALASPAFAQDDPLTQVLADLSRHDIKNWAYTQTLNITAMDEDAVEIISRHDPSKPEGERVKIISIKPEDSEHKASYDDDYENDIPNYADLDELVEEGVELIREDDKVAIYSVKPNKDGNSFKFGDADIDMADVGADLKGELTVVKGEKPYVSDVRFYIDVPHGSVWLAKIKQLDLGFTFAPEGPDNIMLARSFNMNLDLTTLLFIHVSIDLDMAFSDFTYIGQEE
jgi:hypothetical protein